MMTVSPLYGGIYKWVDKEGNVHFGDHPVDNNASEVKINSHKGPDPEYQQRLEKQKQYLMDGQQARDEKKKQRAEAKKNKKQKNLACQKAKKYLTKLEQHGRLYRGNKDGDRQYLSGSERDEEIAKTRMKVKDKCR